jgi:transposase
MAIWHRADTQSRSGADDAEKVIRKQSCVRNRVIVYRGFRPARVFNLKADRQHFSLLRVILFKVLPDSPP